MANTRLANLLNPQVLADMISAEIGKKVAVTPFANIDTTLQGRAGNTITVPSYKYIGEAADVAEGVACGLSQLTHTTQSATVKKVMKAVDISDEALLSAYGNPMSEIQAQLSKALADKIDKDCMEALVGIESSEGLVYDGSASPPCNFTIGFEYTFEFSATLLETTTLQLAILPTSPVIITFPSYLSADMKLESFLKEVNCFGCMNITFSELNSSSNKSRASIIAL